MAIHPVLYVRTKPIVARLRSESIEVVHPQTVKSFEETCNNINAQDIVITLYFTKNILFRRKLKELAQSHCLMLDTVNQMRLTENRRGILRLLSNSNIRTPRFFYGFPENIPASLGNELIIKHPFGGAINMKGKDEIVKSAQKNVYVEERISNDKKIVRCVTYIFGKIFTRIKKDGLGVNFSLKFGTEPRVQTTKDDIILARLVQEITGMKLFNLDVIQDTVIEVNCCPNFFLYRSAVNHFIAQVKLLL